MSDKVRTILQHEDEADLIPSSIDMFGVSEELAAAQFLAQLHNDRTLPDRIVENATEGLELSTKS